MQVWNPDPGVDWDDLKVALAVARLGSLTRAAREIGVDPSTAGRRLSALEADLGAVLFVRSKAGLAPTEAGEVALTHAREIEARTQSLADEVAPGAPTGPVRLIGNPWMLERLAEVALPALAARHPGVVLRLIGGPEPRSVARGAASVALWFEHEPRDEAFAVRRGEVPYAAYAPAGRDPDGLGWVAFWDDDMPLRAPTRWTRRLAGAEALRMTATDAGALRAAVRAGIGRAILPRCLGDGDPALARLPGEGLARVLHLHAHPDTLKTARVQAVIDWLREGFEGALGAPRAPTRPRRAGTA